MGISWISKYIYIHIYIHVYIYIHTYHIMGNTLEYHWYATSNMMWVWSSSKESKIISMQNPYDQGLINTPQFEMWISQWPSQEPKLEVPTIYIRPM